MFFEKCGDDGLHRMESFILHNGSVLFESHLLHQLRIVSKIIKGDFHFHFSLSRQKLDSFGKASNERIAAIERTRLALERQDETL